MKEIAVVIPCYLDEKVLHETYRRLTAALGKTSYDYEILFVNDGSPDDTWRVIRALHQVDGRVKGLDLSRNYGHQIAVTAGLDATDADAVIVMDSDLQDPPELLTGMIEKWKEGYDIVSAVRSGREGDSLLKRVTADLFYRLLSGLTPTPIPKQAGDFRLMSRNVLLAVRQMRERHRFLRGLAIWTGFKQTTISYERPEGSRGSTGYSLRKMLALAFDALTSFSVVPLRIASVVGLVLFVIANLSAGALIVMKLTGAIPVRGWTMMFVSMAFFSGVQLLLLGVLGEYVGRIYEEVKHRPLYFVAETAGFQAAHRDSGRDFSP